MTQSIDEIIAAIGGPTSVPHQPDGGSDVIPLSPLGLDRSEPDAFPANVNAQQGAGSAGYLTPGAKGAASDGMVEPGNDDHYADQGGPEQRPVLSGIDRLTAGQVNRPEGGAVPVAAPVGRDDTALGRDQSQTINPALKAALAPRRGPFGDPSVGK